MKSLLSRIGDGVVDPVENAVTVASTAEFDGAMDWTELSNGEKVELADGDGGADDDDITVWVIDDLAVKLGDGDDETDSGIEFRLVLSEGDGVSEPWIDSEIDATGVSGIEGTVNCAEIDGDTEVDSEDDGDRDAENDADCDADMDGETDVDTEVELEGDSDAETEDDGNSDTDGEIDADADGALDDDTDTDDVDDSDTDGEGDGGASRVIPGSSNIIGPWESEALGVWDIEGLGLTGDGEIDIEGDGLGVLFGIDLAQVLPTIPSFPLSLRRKTSS